MLEGEKSPKSSSAAAIVGGEFGKDFELEDRGQGPEVAVRIEGEEVRRFGFEGAGEDHEVNHAKARLRGESIGEFLRFFRKIFPRGRTDKQGRAEVCLKLLPFNRGGAASVERENATSFQQCRKRH